MLCGLYPQFGGQITNGGVFLEGQPLEQIVPFERAKRIGMLFQDPDKRFCMATLDQQLTFVLENLQLPADQITAKNNISCKIRTNFAQRSSTLYAVRWAKTTSGTRLCTGN